MTPASSASRRVVMPACPTSTSSRSAASSERFLGRRARAVVAVGTVSVTSARRLSRPLQPVEQPPAGDRDGGHRSPRPAGASCSTLSSTGIPMTWASDHWKISVVQSPPWRRTSWARAGPSGRSWKSTKKSGSTSMPPFGSQSIRSSQRAQLGVELVVPGRVERVGDVEPAAVERELQHLRPAVQLAAARRSACPSTPPSQSWPVSFGFAGSETSYWRRSPCSQLEK